MNIFILRHGIAFELGEHGITEDSERPLTPKGEAKLAKIAAAMRTFDLSYDAILSSPYVRARQTAQIIAEALELESRIQLTDALVPPGDAEKLVDLLRHAEPAAENLLLVGHEPFLSHFVSLLVSGGPACSVQIKKGGLCKLSAEALHAGRCATLEWLLTPKQMLLMA